MFLITLSWNASPDDCSLKLNLSFSEVGITLRDGSIILQGVTGHFNRGQVDFF